MTAAPVWREAGPRSLLFVPGDRAESLLPKAVQSGVDGVIIDFEDAVAPAEKDAARRIGSAAVARAALPIPIAIRVNPVGSPWFEADVAAVLRIGVGAIVLPKCEGVDAVAAVCNLVGSAPVSIIAMIETARGVLTADAIAGANPSVVALAFGAEDFRAEMGLRRSRSGRELLHARSQVILAAVAAGRWALDTPCIEPHGLEATRREALLARALGYAGKLIIHPAQVRPVHDAFAPTAAEVKEAKTIVDAFEVMMNEGSGVQMVAGRMIDRPVMIAAKRLLARASLAAREEEE